MSEFFNGTIVGISQTIIGHPLDTIKTNIQNGKVINKFTCRLLYRGVSFPIISSAMINGLMFYSNSYINKYNKNYFISGGITGIITSPVINVFELYKVRKQLGLPIAKIYRFPFVGLSPTLLRETLAMSLYFGNYNMLKSYEYNIFLSGGISGVTSWLLTYPLDVIKTRIQSGECNNWKNSFKIGNLWRGLLPCLVRSFIVNGFSFKIYEIVK